MSTAAALDLGTRSAPGVGFDASFVVDFAPLLGPISEEAPCGPLIRYGDLWSRIQEARREDDWTLPQGVWKTQRKRADWPEVAKLCVEALASHSKDLQVAAWLTEAWLRIHGFAGLEAGLRLLEALCSRYWVDVHPTLEGGDDEFRIAPLAWLDQRITLVARTTPVVVPAANVIATGLAIVAGPNGEPRALSLSDWESAVLRQHQEQQVEAQREGEREPDDTQVSLDRFRNNAALMPVPGLVAKRREVRAAATAAAELSNLLDRQLSTEAAILRRLRQALDEVGNLLRQLLIAANVDPDTIDGEAARFEAEAAAGGAGAAAAERSLRGRARGKSGGKTEDTSMGDAQGLALESPASAEEASTASGPYRLPPLRSRADAYLALAQIAEFLLRVEPHSPTPYLVRRAVAWGRLPLAAVLEELVETRSDLEGIYKLLGIELRK